MKNFLQFMIPILVIGIIAFFMYRGSTTTEAERELYVSCGSTSDKFEVHSGAKMTFGKKEQPCHLEIEILSVNDNYIKLGTAYLWGVDERGNLDLTEPKRNNIIELEETVELYSYDKQTKYTFEYK